MTSRIEIVDEAKLDSIRWPDNQESDYVRRYITPIIRNGSKEYFDNVEAKVFALIVDDVTLPIAVTDGNYSDSNVCSPYSHYVKYTAEELRRITNPFTRGVLKSSLFLLGPFFKAGKINKVVYVNNWFFATNPCPELSSEKINLVTNFLRERFSNHSIIFRSVNTYLHRRFYNALKENGYRMVRSRKIYIIDPKNRAFRKNKNVKRDINLLRKGPYRILGNEQIKESDISEITKLYRLLYLDKYSRFNPQFTDRFFSLVLEKKIFEFKILKNDGRIDAFAGYYKKKSGITGAVLGCNTNLPVELGLTRQAFALMIAEAKKSGQCLNLSAGVGEFKRFRSAEPVVEYDSVYYDHLPFSRRLPWIVLKFSLEAWQYLSSALFDHNPELT